MQKARNIAMKVTMKEVGLDGREEAEETPVPRIDDEDDDDFADAEIILKDFETAEWIQIEVPRVSEPYSYN